MSNIKDVYIHGTIPFDLGNNDDLTMMLGVLNMPAMGIRIIYHGHDYIKNEDGGRTAMYQFRILGHEAFQFQWFEDFKTLVLKAGGTIERDKTFDWEEATREMIQKKREG